MEGSEWISACAQFCKKTKKVLRRLLESDANGLSAQTSVNLQMFLRAGQMAELDKQRTELMNESAITIQRHMRGYFARANFVQRKAAVITLQVHLVLPKRSIPRCLELSRESSNALGMCYVHSSSSLLTLQHRFCIFSIAASQSCHYWRTEVS